MYKVVTNRGSLECSNEHIHIHVTVKVGMGAKDYEILVRSGVEYESIAVITLALRM